MSGVSRICEPSKRYTPPKFNSSPLKHGDWKTSLSYWDSVTFSVVKLLNFGEGNPENRPKLPQLLIFSEKKGSLLVSARLIGLFSSHKWLEKNGSPGFLITPGVVTLYLKSNIITFVRVCISLLNLFMLFRILGFAHPLQFRLAMKTPLSEAITATISAIVPTKVHRNHRRF